MYIAALLAMTTLILMSQMVVGHTSVGNKVVLQLGGREPQIDGLRGVCATAVALHHFVFFAYWHATGTWAMPEAMHFFYTAGKGGVAVFFLICAYLFWGRLARNATFREFDWGRFLENRIRRLVPMYVVAMTAALVIVGLVDQGFEFRVPPHLLAVQVLQSYSFDFLHSPEFNGSFIAYAAIGVSWSLKYEWCFYASLPVISLIQIRRYWQVGLPLILAANELLIHQKWVDYFLYGSIAYELVRYPIVRRFCGTHAAGLLSIGGILLTCRYAEDVQGGWPALALSAAFLPIAGGNDWLGLLSMRGTRFLGAISYSLYLLNVIVEAQVVRFLPVNLASANVVVIAISMSVVLMLLVAISYVTYSCIEVRFQKAKVTSQATPKMSAAPREPGLQPLPVEQAAPPQAAAAREGP